MSSIISYVIAKPISLIWFLKYNLKLFKKSIFNKERKISVVWSAILWKIVKVTPIWGEIWGDFVYICFKFSNSLQVLLHQFLDLEFEIWYTTYTKVIFWHISRMWCKMMVDFLENRQSHPKSGWLCLLYKTAPKSCRICEVWKNYN